MDKEQKTIMELLHEKELIERKLSISNDLTDYYFAKSERLSEENEKLKAEIQQLESKNENQKSCINAARKYLIEWVNRSKELEKKYDDLSKEFDRAINYIKMIRKFSDNAED